METKQVTKDRTGLFTLALQNEKIYIALGNKVVSDKQFASRKAANDYIASKPYELIFNVCYIMAETIVKNSKLQEK